MSGNQLPTTIGEIEAFVNKYPKSPLKPYKFEATLKFVDTVSVIMLKRLIQNEIAVKRADQNTSNFSEKEGHIRQYRDLLDQLENTARI